MVKTGADSILKFGAKPHTSTLLGYIGRLVEITAVAVVPAVGSTR